MPRREKAVHLNAGRHSQSAYILWALVTPGKICKCIHREQMRSARVIWIACTWCKNFHFNTFDVGLRKSEFLHRIVTRQCIPVSRTALPESYLIILQMTIVGRRWGYARVFACRATGLLRIPFMPLQINSNDWWCVIAYLCRRSKSPFWFTTFDFGSSL